MAEAMLRPRPRSARLLSLALKICAQVLFAGAAYTVPKVMAAIPADTIRETASKMPTPTLAEFGP